MPSPGPEGEKPELCHLLAPSEDPRGGGLFPASGPPLTQTSRPGGRGSISLAILGTRMDRHLPFGKPSL